MRLSDTENIIIDTMARAFFVSTWADKQDRLAEQGRKNQNPGPGGDWMDIAPRTPRYVRDFALMFAGRIGGSLLVHLNSGCGMDMGFHVVATLSLACCSLTESKRTASTSARTTF